MSMTSKALSATDNTGYGQTGAPTTVGPGTTVGSTPPYLGEAPITNPVGYDTGTLGGASGGSLGPGTTGPNAGQTAAEALAQETNANNEAALSSLGRMTDPQWEGGATGTQLAHQSAAVDAMPDVGGGVPSPADQGDTYVTVPVDKVLVSPTGAKTITPTYAAGRGQRKAPVQPIVSPTRGY